MIIGITEAAQDISFDGDGERAARRSSTSMLKDPAVASVGSYIGPAARRRR